jgi:histidyl-tRNA synthetase
MALSKQPVKGARDFYPEQKRLQNHIFQTWGKVCERFGYEEYDSPIVEHTDIYLAKGNEEIIKEQTYTFDDRGGRSLTLRTEMTPSVSRLVAAKRQELGYPQRLYSMPQCWRYERMQRGRGREFYQLNVDIFGNGNISEDVEVIQVADGIMQEFGAKRTMYEIQLNSRKLTKHVFWTLYGIRDDKYNILVQLVDKKEKMQPDDFKSKLLELLGAGSESTVSRVLDYLNAESITALPDDIKQTDEAEDLTSFIAKLKKLGISNAKFTPTLMRGFDYYTDIVFEVIDTNPDNNRSMFGGGRYDGLVGMFGVDPVPTCGFGMGDITLQHFLENHKLLPELSAATDVFIAPLNVTNEQLDETLADLRLGVNVAVGSEDTKLDKHFKTAEKLGVKYLVVVGEKELESGKFGLKDINSGKTEILSINEIKVKFVK